MKIDAHCHTDCSDGTVSIEERIRMIKACGYEAAIITDHDFISSEQVRRARREAGDMPFIPGIELTACHDGKIVHVLGYFIDSTDAALQSHISAYSQADKEFTDRLLAALAAEQDIQISPEDFSRPTSLHTIGHLMLVKELGKKWGNDHEAAYHSYCQALSHAGLTWMDLYTFPVRQAVSLIHHAGGIAVLAHPGHGKDPFMKELNFLSHDRATIETYIDWGLDGIETSAPSHTDQEKNFYESLAAEYRLLSTEGSDCHGDDPYLGPRTMGIFPMEKADGYEQILSCWQQKQKKQETMNGEIRQEKVHDTQTL